MADLILHHYPTSPFSEKIRLVLGYKRLGWKSVLIPSVLPKPDLVALTGGYRRTPVLQVGADIYCDTALICDVLEQRAPEPTLYPPQHKGLSRIVAQWADGTLFWAAMGYNLSPRGAAAMFRNAPPGAAEAFAKDRGAMRTPGMPRLPAPDASAAYRSYLRRLAETIDHSPYLFGEQPCIADFAAYHPLWFSRVRIPEMADIFEPVPQLLAWMDRLAQIGHGQSEKFDSAAALEVARQAGPAPIEENEFFQNEHGIALGSRVAITAESFGVEPTEGVLVAATRMHYTLRRDDARAGTLHVHFPRIGYVMKKVDPT